MSQERSQEKCHKQEKCERQENCEKNNDCEGKENCDKNECCKKPENDLQSLIKALQEENEVLKKQAEQSAEFKENWYRSRADFENFKKRNNETRKIAYEEGKSDIIKKILVVGDNLERAVATVADEKTKQGLEMVVRQFKETLLNLGVTEIDPTGEEFDPNKAEAVMMADASEGEKSGTVKQVFLKGYSLGDKIIRFAQVVVIK